MELSQLGNGSFVSPEFGMHFASVSYQQEDESSMIDYSVKGNRLHENADGSIEVTPKTPAEVFGERVLRPFINGTCSLSSHTFQVLNNVLSRFSSWVPFLPGAAAEPDLPVKDQALAKCKKAIGNFCWHTEDQKPPRLYLYLHSISQFDSDIWTPVKGYSMNLSEAEKKHKKNQEEFEDAEKKRDEALARCEKEHRDNCGDKEHRSFTYNTSRGPVKVKEYSDSCGLKDFDKACQLSEDSQPPKLYYKPIKSLGENRQKTDTDIWIPVKGYLRWSILWHVQGKVSQSHSRGIYNLDKQQIEEIPYELFLTKDYKVIE